MVAQAPPATCIVPPGAAAVRAPRVWAVGDAPPPAFADRVRLVVANIPARTPPADLLRRLPWSWTLVTRTPRACLGVAAVQVWAESGGRITDVNVLLGSP